ncbi:hypothetical protein MUCCIDRAFT_109424 [Mucor lusitanicus CBS 277.49]|uniref:CTLH domain-containing protein n=1 Tax=Mucor lusitanicus CBS 277.49 TaxID=747725 RepID=A0A162MUE6_MUCCL|nr:hypothetical protein MUCCIDRAFT_109424 [Mucor lusitanicus CBS 277.49]
MEYLLHYCYKDTAKALLDEMQHLDECSKAIKLKVHNADDQAVNVPSNHDKKHTVDISMLDKNNIEWNHIDARKDIHNAIREGDIGRAFTLIEKHFPDLMRIYNTINRMEVALQDRSTLPKSHCTIYKLRCQQFVETLRSSGPIEAIQFAKFYFRPCSKLYKELTDDATSLIAYTDLASHDRSSQHHRDRIADEVNEMILESQHFSPQTALEKLWRQKTAIQVELDNQKRQASSQDQQELENTKTPM